MPHSSAALLSGQKIMVVDDDPEMRLALQIRLKANNYQVSTAADGISAISEIRRVMPDLVLLDLGLPAGDGFTVLERLKANPAFESIPVIVISGRDRLLNRERSEKAGAIQFMQKPVRHAELLQTIRKTLNRSTVVESVAEPVIYDLQVP